MNRIKRGVIYQVCPFCGERKVKQCDDNKYVCESCGAEWVFTGYSCDSCDKKE